VNRKVVVIASAMLVGLTVTAGASVYFLAGPTIAAAPAQDVKPSPSAQALKAVGLDEKAAHATADKRSRAVCDACHVMQTEETPWHRRHLEDPIVNLTCNTCHMSVSTSPRTAAGKVTIDRSVCLKCHVEVFYGFTPEHEDDNWMELHRRLRGDKLGGVDIPSMTELRKREADCFACHAEPELDFCADCHDYHPTGRQWSADHGEQAVSGDFKCLNCHDKEQWCSTQCHQGVSLPHNIPRWERFWAGQPDAPKWLKTHGAAGAEKGLDACRLCHKLEGEGRDFCQSCHHERFDTPGLWISFTPGLSQHPKVVKDVGGGPCFTCHEPEFCADCHINKP
jgi:hypothetical protein